MGQYKDIRLVSGGINTDDDIRDIDATDYLLESKNLSSGVSISGALMNIKGTTKVNYTLWTGRNKCIGALRDIKRNAIIYFIWNSNNQHAILHYMCGTNTIEEIFAPSAALPNTGIPFDTSFLGFTEFNKIHSANILDDILLWVDGVTATSNPPRKVNIKRAKDFMLQLTPSVTNTPYNNLIATGVLANKEQFINSIKYAPLVPADIALGQDTTRSTNYIRNKMLQVRYRWIYDDNEKSRWNTGSYVSLPEGQENVNGILSNGVQNNYLAVTYNTGHPTVKAIDIAFRFDNLGSWQRLDEPIDKYDKDNQPILSDFSDEVYNFYNDRVLIPVDVADSDINFDAIPLKAQSEEIIDGNRLVYAGNVEGYENPELDVTTDFGNTLVPMNTIDTTTIVLDHFVNAGSDYASVNIPYINNGRIKAGDVISFGLVYSTTGFNGTISYTVTEDDLTNFYPLQLADNIRRYTLSIVPTLAGFWLPSIFIGGEEYSAAGFFEYIVTVNLTNANIIGATTEVPSFKKGTFQKFALAYYDAQNRDGGAITTPEFVQYIKTFPELYPNGAEPLDNTNAYQSYVDIFINHIPPDWAVKYQILKAKNNLSKYIQFPLRVRSVTTPSGNIELDLSYLMEYKNNKLVNGSLNFQFEDGDRVRFIANVDYYCPQYVEVPVLAFNPTNNILTVGYFDWGDVYGNMAVTTSEGMLVEYFAYSANADPENEFYYEMGEVFDIIQPYTANRRHAGITDGLPTNQNAAHTVPAQVRLRYGDTYEYRRYFNATDRERIVESENFSDYYASANFNISRVQGVRNETTKLHGQQIRYGGRYFADTLTNNLLSFDGANFDTLQTTYGPINKVLTVGYVLKALQTKKITSIYINRSMIFNADGTPQISLINAVLGTKDPSNLDYGCADPTSVCKDERQMYFFDRNTGTLIQDSANGMIPVSNYKFIKGMKDKTNQILAASGNIFVYASVDNFISTVNISFVNEDDPTSEINDTYIYNTNDNRWKPRQSYLPDYVCSNGLVFVSFKDGELYTHNTNPLRNVFYDVQYDSVISTVSNVDPSKVKVFDSLWERATKLFSCPTIGDITVLPSGNYPLGMQSRLVAGKFREKEGQFYSDFLRDALTPNSVSTSDALINGRKLRGEAIVVNLSNSDTDEVTLYQVIINSSYSDMS